MVVEVAESLGIHLDNLDFSDMYKDDNNIYKDDNIVFKDDSNVYPEIKEDNNLHLEVEEDSNKMKPKEGSSSKLKVKDIKAYLIIVIFFTLTQFLGLKFYTEKMRKLRQNTQ